MSNSALARALRPRRVAHEAPRNPTLSLLATPRSRHDSVDQIRKEDKTTDYGFASTGLS